MTKIANKCGIFAVILFFSVALVRGCYPNRYYGRRKRAALEVNSKLAYSFFGNCDELIGASRGLFDSLQSNVDYTIGDTSWYEQISSKVCFGGKNVASCWQNSLPFLITPDSVLLFQAASKCICEYAGIYCDAEISDSENQDDKRRKRQVMSDQLTSEEKQFSSCIQRGTPSNSRYNAQKANSVIIFLRDHYSWCRSIPKNFSGEVMASACHRRGREPEWRRDVRSVFIEATREGSPLRSVARKCRSETKTEDKNHGNSDSRFRPQEANGDCNIIPPGLICSFMDKKENQLIELDEEQDDYKEACKTAEVNGDCCWVEDDQKCYSKNKGSGKKPSSKNPFTDPPDPKEVEKDISAKVSARHLFLDPLCIPPLPFPSGCKFTRTESFVTIPPTQVPYCVRIPCSLDAHEQSFLDKNHFACGSTPGCYFDVELHEYREAFGPAVLPGVPVCHLAIRNSVFLHEANLVKTNTKSAAWNPYYTNCLLNKWDEEIRKGPSGCELIPLLQVFKFYPKLAGWEGITSYECILIDGCWSDTRGCSYPVDIDDLIVKSGQRFSFHKHEVAYGRPKCQHFFTDNPYEILKSYHRCLASGCTVDLSISANYYHYFFDIGLQMSVRDMWFYWAAVLTGQIGPFNLDSGIYWNWDKEFKGRNLILGPSEAPETTTETTTGAEDLFWFPGVSRRKRSIFGGQSDACGFAFKGQGYRPCRPAPVPKIKRGPNCPYKPFFVPRFNPLKGIFTGCCKINYCYISKHEIRKMHSGPAIYYTEWTDWTACTKTCGRGKGTKTRTRKCIAHDKDLCHEQVKDDRPCGGNICDEWATWRNWGPPCPPGSAGCGYQQTRTRDCFPNPRGCVGKGRSEETRPCKCRTNAWDAWTG